LLPRTILQVPNVPTAELLTDSVATSATLRSRISGQWISAISLPRTFPRGGRTRM
jgi:hypothetical protein